MKFLKIFIILCLIIVTSYVLIIDNKMHKHFILANKGFDLSLNTQEHQETQSAILFRIGEKQKSKNKTEKITETEEINSAAREVKIIPSDILISKMQEQTVTNDNTTSINTTITSSENNFADNMEVLQKVIDMVDKNEITENDIQDTLSKIQAESKTNNEKHQRPGLVDSGFNKNQNSNYDNLSDQSCPKCDMLNKNTRYKDETIAWNIWRSNIQNRIMDDSAVDANYGAIFLFSFKVDKNRNITNIKVTCTDKSDHYSVDAVRTAIKNLNGKKILEYPVGTNRKIVDFSGGFLIGTYSQYSSPSDYNDFEQVRLRY